MTITEVFDFTFMESPTVAAPDATADATITGFFDDVFFEGAGGLSAQVPFPYPVAIDGRAFAIELRSYQWEIPDMVRQAIDFSSRPGEQSFDTGGVWLRTTGDWSLGAGQHYLDGDRSSTRRFESSIGIDPWTYRKLSLLPDTDVAVASDSDTLRMIALGAYVYLMDGEAQTLQRSTDMQSDPPTLTDITGGPSEDLIDMTTDGDFIYLAAADGIYKHDSSAGAALVAYGGAASTTIVQIIEYANGWLLVGAANVLSSIDAAGAVTVEKTHPVAGFVWAAIVGTPSNIYAGGQADDVAELYRIGIDEATGGLAVPIHAGELPRGEKLRSLAYYGGVVLIGTSRGFRIGEVLGDGGLDIGPLIETPGDVHAAYGEGEFVWYGLSDFDNSHTGVGRAKLSEFTLAENLPAYASDLMALESGAVVDVLRFGGRTYFAVAGSGFWREQTDGDRVAQGTIELGKLEWGTFEPKTFLGVELVTEPLNGRIIVSQTDDNETTIELGQFDVAGANGRGRTIGAGRGSLSSFYGLTLQLVRSDDDATLGPVLRLLTARALPVPRQVQRWTLPIMCHEKIKIGPGEDIEASQDVAEVRAFFTALRKQAKPVIYQEGDAEHLVIVRGVAFPEGGVDRWGQRRRALQGTLVVTLDSAEP